MDLRPALLARNSLLASVALKAKQFMAGAQGPKGPADRGGPSTPGATQENRADTPAPVPAATPTSPHNTRLSARLQEQVGARGGPQQGSAGSGDRAIRGSDLTDPAPGGPRGDDQDPAEGGSGDRRAKGPLRATKQPKKQPKSKKKQQQRTPKRTPKPKGGHGGPTSAHGANISTDPEGAGRGADGEGINPSQQARSQLPPALKRPPREEEGASPPAGGKRPRSEPPSRLSMLRQNLAVHFAATESEEEEGSEGGRALDTEEEDSESEREENAEVAPPSDPEEPHSEAEGSDEEAVAVTKAQLQALVDASVEARMAGAPRGNTAARGTMQERKGRGARHPAAKPAAKRAPKEGKSVVARAGSPPVSPHRKGGGAGPNPARTSAMPQQAPRTVGQTMRPSSGVVTGTPL